MRSALVFVFAMHVVIVFFSAYTLVLPVTPSRHVPRSTFPNPHSPSPVPHSHTASSLFPAAVAFACLDCCKLPPPVHIHACPVPLSSPASPCLRHLICSSSSSPCHCHHHHRRRSRSCACFPVLPGLFHVYGTMSGVVHHVVIIMSAHHFTTSFLCSLYSVVSVRS